jgi:hypothetical protein
MALGSFNATIVNSSGEIVPGAEVEVRRTSDNALATLFSDASRTAITNPFNANATTAFAQFFAERDTYTVAASTGAGIVTWTVDITPSSDGATYAPTRAEALLLNVPDAQDILFVRSGVGLLAYKRDASSTALTTADGQRWSPDGDVYPDHWAANTTPGTTDMQAALVGSVAYCFIAGRSLRGGGQYLASGNVPNLWDVTTNGTWSILQDGSTWHASPQGNSQLVVIYCTNDGSAQADGRTAAQGTTFGSAWARMLALGSKSADGRWRIQMEAGTFTDAGVVISKVPYFRYPLEVFGRSAGGLGAVPETVWSGTGNATYAAMRGGLSNSENGFLNINFESIKFINWSQNGIIYWHNGIVLCRNLHAANTPYPFDFRGLRLDITGGIIDGATGGIRSYCGCNASIGGFGANERITFNNCDLPWSVSRGGIAYVENCLHTGTMTHNGAVSQLARIRTQGNTFGASTSEIINVENGIWDQAKDDASADVFPTLTETMSAYTARGTASIQGLSVLGSRFMHVRSGRTGGTNQFTVDTVGGVASLLSDGSLGGGDWVPFRLPKFTLFSPTVILEVDVEFTLAEAHSGGVFALHGNGPPSAANLLGVVNIPSVAGFTRGTIKLRVINDPGASTGSYEGVWTAAGGLSTGSTANLASTSLRDNDASGYLFRLYWTPASAGDAVFSNLITYVTL